MIHSQFRSVLRSQQRGTGFGLLNVGGLAVGIAGCLLIALFARSEWAVNRDISDVDRLYRVDSDWRESGMGIPMTTLAPVGQTLAREYPEVESQTRIYGMMNTVRVGEDSYREDVMLVDSTLFDVFDLPFLAGDPGTALDRPRSVVLTERRARAWFGDGAALGGVVLVETWNNGWQPFTVTGVLGDLPYNSFTNGFAEDGYDVIMPYASNGDFIDDAGWGSWQSRYILQVVRLAPEARLDDLQERLAAFVPTHAPPEFHGNLEIRLNPFRTLHLTEFNGRGLRTLRLLAIIAGVILMLACVNYANLATARSLSRLREVGVRKALGAHRGQLAAQFLGESLLSSLVAAAAGLVVAILAEKPFMDLLDRPRMLPAVVDGWTLGIVAILAVFTGLVAGAYPALVFSSFRPSAALRQGSDRTTGGGTGVARMRAALVVVQFAAAIVLVISVVTMARQLDRVGSADLGFRSEQVLVIDSVPRNWDEQGLALAERARDRIVQDVAGVRSASVSWGTASDGASNTRALLPAGRDPSTAVNAPYFLVDDAFLRTFDLRLVAGRFFSDGRASDPQGIVINETAARAFGWTPREAVGQTIQAWFQANAGDTEAPGHPVIGVVGDHHYELMRRPVRPAAYFSLRAEPMFRVLSLSLAAGDLAESLEAVRRAWTEVFPTAAFEYYILEDRIDAAFARDRQVRTLVGMAALLALFLAGMGMLALASISVARRTKEVGIRRTLGASVTGLAVLLSREFLALVAVAAAGAAPIAWVVMQRWTEGFAHGSTVSAWVVVLVAVGVLAFAGLVVSVHTLRAATANPSDSLRYE